MQNNTFCFSIVNKKEDDEISDLRKCTGSIAKEPIAEDQGLEELYSKLSFNSNSFFDFKAEKIEYDIFDLIFIIESYQDKKYWNKVRYLISKIIKDAEIFFNNSGAKNKIPAQDFINIFYIKYDDRISLMSPNVYHYLNVSDFYKIVENESSFISFNDNNLWGRINSLQLRNNTEKFLFHFYLHGENLKVDEDAIVESRNLNLKINIVDFSDKPSDYFKELENFISFDVTKAKY